MLIDKSGVQGSLSGTLGYWQYQQNGFNVSMKGHVAFYPNTILPKFGTLARKSVFANDPSAYTFTRNNGGLFGLKNINIASIWPDVTPMNYDIYQTCQGGSNCNPILASALVTPVWKAIKLVGKLADGSVISTAFSPWQGVLSAVFDSTKAISKAGNGVFGAADFGKAFAAVKSLTISVDYPGIPAWSTSRYGDTVFGNSSMACSPANLDRLPASLASFAGICAGQGDATNYWAAGGSPGGGDLAVFLSSISFGVPPPVSPVPLPAGLLLLGACLLLLPIAARGKRTKL